MPKTEKKLFDKETSLTKLLVEYYRPKPGNDSKKRTYYSFLDQDEKSRQHGINRLRKYAISNLTDLNFAAIYDNISGGLIENVINNGKLI